MQAGVLGLKRGAGTGTRDPPAEARNAVVGLVFLGEGSFEAKAEMSLCCHVARLVITNVYGNHVAVFCNV